MTGVAGMYSTDGVSQADTRAEAEFTDQHGRTWSANTENKTRHPIGVPRPMFDAPLIPFGQYMTIKGTNKIVIEYRRWLTDMDESDRLYDTDLRNHAQALYGDKALEAIEHPSPALIALAGERPRRVPREFVEAASQDNQWVLGLTAAVPNWADPFIEREAAKKAAPTMALYPDANDEVEAVEEEQPDDYVLIKGPGGRWKMPDGTGFGGDEEEAMANLESWFPDEYAKLLVEA